MCAEHSIRTECANNRTTGLSIDTHHGDRVYTFHGNDIRVPYFWSSGLP